MEAEGTSGCVAVWFVPSLEAKLCRVLRICFWICVCCACSLSRRHCCSTSIFTARPKPLTSELKVWIWSSSPPRAPVSATVCLELCFPSLREATWLPRPCSCMMETPGAEDIGGVGDRLGTWTPTRGRGWRERTDRPGRVEPFCTVWRSVTVCATWKLYRKKHI